MAVVVMWETRDETELVRVRSASSMARASSSSSSSSSLVSKQHSMTMSSSVTKIWVLASAAAVRGQYSSHTFRLSMHQPISFRLYFSSILATLKSSFRMDLFFAFVGLFLSSKKADSDSIAAASSLATFRPSSLWKLGGCVAGLMTSRRMCFKTWTRSILYDQKVLVFARNGNATEERHKPLFHR